MLVRCSQPYPNNSVFVVKKTTPILPFGYKIVNAYVDIRYQDNVYARFVRKEIKQQMCKSIVEASNALELIDSDDHYQEHSEAFVEAVYMGEIKEKITIKNIQDWSQAIYPDNYGALRDTSAYTMLDNGSMKKYMEGNRFILKSAIENLLWNLSEEDDWVDITRVHHEFTLIHPFPDSNGRTGRLLLNYHAALAKNCWIRLCDRNAYLRALSQADNGNLVPLGALIKESAIR